MSRTESWKMVSIVAGMLVIAAAAAAADTKSEGKPEDGAQKLPYKLSLAIETGDAESNQVSIDPKGVVTASIAYSAPGSPIRAIGRSVLTAGPSDPDLVAIGKQITAGGLVGGTPFWTSEREGVRFMVLDIQQDGKETKHYANSAEPLPEPLEAVTLSLMELMSRAALKAPQRTVSIHPKFDSETVTVGGRARLTLDIKNSGTARADLRSFSSFRDGKAGELKVDLWIPPANKGGVAKFVSSVDLGGNEWHATDGTPFSAKDPYVKLPAAGSLSIWTEIRLPEAVAPGALLADLLYHAQPASDAERKNDGLVVGLFRSDPVTLTVAPKSAP